MRMRVALVGEVRRDLGGLAGGGGVTGRFVGGACLSLCGERERGGELGCVSLCSQRVVEEGVQTSSR